MAGLGSIISSKNNKKKKQQQQQQQEKTTKNSLNPNDDIINSPEYKFGRLLASPQARTRHSTILKLQQYLQARTDPSKKKNCGLSVLDLMKLWKGLWHTLYLCDGVAVQEEVSKLLAKLIWSVGGTLEEDEYAGRFYLDLDEDAMGEEGGDDNDDVDGNDEMQIIEMSDEEEEKVDDQDVEDNETEKDSDMNNDNVNDFDNEEDDEEEEEEVVTNPAEDEETKHCRGAHLSALFIRTYFRTLNREWSNMDKYRIDKFYTLTRFILRETYRYMASRHWNLGIIRLFNDAIFEEVLRVHKFGNGVRFHLLDICLDELALVNSDRETTGLVLTEATYLDCMEPYFATAQRVEDEKVQERVMEKVLLKFLEEYSIVSDNYSPPSSSKDEKDDKKQEKDSNPKSELVMDQVHVQTVAQFIFEVASDPETHDRYRTELYDMHKIYMKRVKQVGRDVIMDEDDEDKDEQDDDVTAVEEEKFADVADDDVEQSELVDENTNNNEDETKDEKMNNNKEKKSKKKKKKKKKKTKNPIAPIVTESNEEKPPQPSKAAKKVKDNEEEDEVITISSAEQKKAEVAAKKAEKKKSKKRNTTSSSSSDETSGNGNDDTTKSNKKVKFYKMNKSKSFKASMRDLEKVDAKATLERTPEKSILMTSKHGSASGKARKKKGKKV